MPLIYISIFVPYHFDYFYYCSLTKLCSTLCNLMDYSVPDSPVLHYWPRACSNSCPLRHWHYLAISSSANPFSFWLQSFPASRSFPMSQLFASSGQSFGASASATVLPINIQGWFHLGVSGLTFLPSNVLSRVFSSTTIWKQWVFGTKPSLGHRL